ncbi:hypothetical protein COW36_07355 [bacterium (Candidatus Blackallbacteria) CG17_big_fil_post_rev_8_21_14_2_50_48_46]|uniref:VCBS repeat-containing protein n=1 Tax=bacterium (Candidatus Blackallbacteria) CG17_big_fil_post_rev_8_21_14_2_50_48_46 TaxID=2014261 RepID=A0A2M7G798_9BACT|nr:MAG: hypothetical protein COW64_06865 [bacterium (Candidatus Blackallbacteria) CG18_big_fil_WC_8_21_14_2_50_49_26]PIW17877.1 MAG: hypothetical protein COW36_07355 [bacterium (Candidatus Blackallbacteria) CG17_big_fil_post_rev_8_21_14_2_50_48_46]PIW48553.1 MAG: hypothetical protein COW20_09310 [bacterium (Candidatus Blackallbacteria) CG13_big_fil_rev_8_21_14_2_50_49_14]
MPKLLCLSWVCLGLLHLPAQAQSAATTPKVFKLTQLSKLYDVQIQVAACESDFCRGKAQFSLFRKGQKQPFQVFKFAETLLQLNAGQVPVANQTLGYDLQSGVHLQDFNFDGQPDLALCDGQEAGYGGPSYQIYLYSARSQKFEHSPALSKLARGEYLGMFEVDTKNKILRNFGKSGCCYHFTHEYKLKNNQPYKTREVIEDGLADPAGKWLQVTTSEWVSGKWVSKVKREPMSQ